MRMGNAPKDSNGTSASSKHTPNPDISPKGRGGRKRPGRSWPPLAAACVGSNAKARSRSRRKRGWMREIAMGARGRHPRERRWALGSGDGGCLGLTRSAQPTRPGPGPGPGEASREHDPLPTEISEHKASKISQQHQWSSGRIVPCHGTDPGSIPGWCNFLRF